MQLVHKIFELHHPSPSVVQTVRFNQPFKENQKDTVNTVGTEAHPKNTVAHIRVKNVKCIFVRLIYSISFLTTKTRLDVLCPCPPEGFQPLGQHI